MAPLKLSERFLNNLPAGVTPDQVRLIHCTAELIEEKDAEPLPVAIAGLVQAGPPMITDGKPTLMKIVAWMAHEGINGNRQAFVRDDLQRLAPALFRDPNFGVMDFNHSAVAYFTDEPKVIGLWHKAEYRFDEKAQKYGVLASGVMFSWLFPDHADTLLAEQARKGHMSFSMACIPSRTELAQDEHGVAYEIMHDPVFFTVSALDVRPADKDAAGLGGEATADTEETLRQRLLATATSRPWQANVTMKAAELSNEAPNEGAAMEIENQTTDEVTEVVAEVAETVVDTTVETTEEAVAETDVAETVAEVAEPVVEDTADDDATRIAELELARDGLSAELEKALAQIEALTTQVETLSAKLADIDAKSNEVARAEKLETRLATLPEAFRKAHEAKTPERRARLEAKWVDMPDSEWADYVADELLGYVPEGKLRLSYLERSRLEGIEALPSAKIAETSIAARVDRLLKR